MKKSFTIFTLLFCALMFVQANNTSTSLKNNLVGETWKFKNLASQDLLTTDYMTTLYEESEYKFSDNNTYTCILHNIASSGVWDISNNMLFLNKGTNKEETYTFSFPANHKLVLQATERGTEVFIEFESK